MATAYTTKNNLVMARGTEVPFEIVGLVTDNTGRLIHCIEVELTTEVYLNMSGFSFAQLTEGQDFPKGDGAINM